MHVNYLAFVFLSALFVSIQTEPSTTETFSNKNVLVSGFYIVYWNFNKTDITFELHVKTTGWAGFGISPNGEMENSDVIVFWVNSNGSANFTERNTKAGLILPAISANQTWTPLITKSQDGWLISKSTRKIKQCDSTGEHLDITFGTPFLIYSWGNNFLGGDISYHGPNNRSVKSLPLISSLNTVANINMSQVVMTDFKVNTTLNPISTEYYCQVFPIPTAWIAVKRHAIRFETLITPGNENLLHHWLMYECDQRYEKFLKNNSAPKSGPCYSQFSGSSNSFDPKWNTVWNFCNKVSLAWGVGGDLIQDIPNNMAYPIGGDPNEFKYFILQIHYNNQALSRVKDYSGMRLYTTLNYRPLEFGVLTVGSDSTPLGILIPPGDAKYSLEFDCSSDCLNNIFVDSPNITIFASLLHTHTLGSQFYSTVIRDGKEIAYIGENEYYNFNYQYINYLQNPVQLKQNDKIKVNCVYDSSKANRFYAGGLSTEEEMCLNFIWYYPKSKGTYRCIETFNGSDLYSFLIGLNRTGEVYYSLNPQVVLNTSSTNLGPKFENFYFNSNRFEICSTMNNETISTIKRVIATPIPDETCPVNKPTLIQIIISIIDKLINWLRRFL